MSSSELAISVRDLSKTYYIAPEAGRHTSIGEALVHRLRHPFERARKEVFQALTSVSFDINQGEVVGIGWRQPQPLSAEVDPVRATALENLAVPHPCELCLAQAD